MPLMCSNFKQTGRNAAWEKKNWYRVTPLWSFIAVTKVTSNTRTRKEHLFAEERIYHINYGVLQGFPALRKAVTTNVKKYNIFWRVFDIANQLLNVTRLYSVRLINERQSLHHSLSKIVCWNVFGLWLNTTRITLSLTDSDVRTFLEGEEEKPKVTYSVALVLAFLAAKNEKSTTGRFATSRFLLRTLKISSVGKDQLSEYIISLHLLFVLKPRSLRPKTSVFTDRFQI